MNSNTAAEYTLKIDQGADFNLQFLLKDSAGDPIDLTGCSIEGQMRTTTEDAIAYDLTVGFSGTPTDGIVNVSMDATDTSLLPVLASRTPKRVPTYFCYDIALTKADGKIIRILQGLVEVSPEVTR